MKKSFLKGLLAAGALAFSAAASAEDIDLFMVPTPDTVDKPNVLIIVDNTANWNSAFTNEMNALAEVFTAIPESAFRVGIMFSAETGSPNNSIAGGYVRGAVRLMTNSNKQAYRDMILSLDKKSDKGNGGQASLVMAEAYRYLSGGVPYAGNNKAKADYTGNTFGTAQSKAVYALGNNALASFGALQYNPPNSGCQKNFIIYISNGAPGDNNSVITQSTAMLSAAATAAGISGATTAIPVSPSGSQDNVSDEWARFMKKSPLGVTTYTIDVDPSTGGRGPGWTALLKSMAAVSKGQYFDASSAGTGEAIKNAMNSILSQIQAFNSVFAAVSLPVSVNTQGTYLNQVFVGMFRPDETSKPRWNGNLKQYKLGVDSNGLLGLLDADGGNAISSGGTGFIAECARSFWTPTTVDTYWTFSPQGACLAVANSDVSNFPDGNIVEKGAQAYKLRSTTSRTVLTCSSGCTGLTDFDNTIAATQFGAADNTEWDAIVQWAKGLDVDNEKLTSPAPATIPMRPSAHGDVVHSRPVALNFGASDTDPQVVVFYGGNDGLLRAVNGNRDGGLSIGGKAPGMELWSFIGPEFYPHIKRIRDNTTTISYVGNPVLSPVPQPKRYGFDGAIAAYKDTDMTAIFATMRRGGRAIYAFDVANPASPSLKWRQGCSDNFPDTGSVVDTNCTADFSGIGQTWSAPKALKTAGYTSGTGAAKPMLIVGGGYDTCEDTDSGTANHSCASSTKGDKVYVLDANTGVRLAALDTDRAVVADVFVVPDAATGMAKYAYAVDLGGNIYRISGTDAFLPFATTTPGNWTITKIASLGCADANACDINRKFMFMPDIVEDNGKYVLLLGSGDREKPLNDYVAAASVSNYFFMVKDDPSDTEWLESESETCGDDVICLDSLHPIGVSDASPTLATVESKKGWYVALNPKEQVVTSAITIFGTVTFSTHQPAVYDDSACTSDLGTARVYNISYAVGASMNGTTSRGEEVAGGGLSPSPVAGMVKLDDGRTVPFCIGCSSDSPLQGRDPPPPPIAFQPKSRVYWHIQQ